MKENIWRIVRLLTFTILFFTLLFANSWAGGWYLMVAPPKVNNTENKPDLSCPLKYWDQRKSFDSANDCEARRMRELASFAALVGAASVEPNAPFDDALIDATEQYILTGNSSNIPPALVGPISRALLDNEPGYLCIATDDPRLNEKPMPRERKSKTKK